MVLKIGMSSKHLSRTSRKFQIIIARDHARFCCKCTHPRLVIGLKPCVFGFRLI